MAVLLKSPAALEQVREQVVTNWRQWKDDRAELEETWKRCMMAYLCRFDKKWAEYAKQSNRSCRYVGVSHDAVETWAPQIYNQILGRDEAITLRPAREGMDNQIDDKMAEDMKYLLRYQMEWGKYRRTMMTGIKSLGILGNCPWWMNWYVKRAVNYKQFADAMARWTEQAADYQAEYQSIMEDWQGMVIRAQMMGVEPPAKPDFAPPPEPPRELDVVFQGPVLKVGSIFNYVQEQHPNDDMSALRIMRSWRTLEYLKRFTKPDATGYVLYENLKNVFDATSEDRASDNEAEALVKMALGLQMPQGANKVEIKEQHGTFEIASGPEAGIYENWIVAVANDTAVIRCEPTPMYSGRLLINNARLTTIEGAVYGIGIIEKALDEQDTVNAVHNQNIDAVNAVIQPESEVVVDWLVDGIMKPSGPGVRHEVTQQGAITPIQKNFQGLPLGFAVEEAAIARHERMTGAVNTASGSRESATRTARNANIIATKLGGAVEAVEEDLIQEALNTAMEMNAQYIDEDVVFSITQDKKSVVKKVSPVDIRRGWLVRVAGSKFLAEKDARVQNLMMAAQITQQAEAGGMPSPVRKDVLYRRLFKEILEESDDMVMSAEDYRALIVEYQAAMAAAQTAAQAGAVQGGEPGTAGDAGGAAGGPEGGPPVGGA
jgi:DNA-binding FrmR family transcriptional regulator